MNVRGISAFVLKLCVAIQIYQQKMQGEKRRVVNAMPLVIFYLRTSVVHCYQVALRPIL